MDSLNTIFAPFSVTFSATPPGGLCSTVSLNTGLSSPSGIDFQNKKKSGPATIHAPKNLEVIGILAPTPAEVVLAAINLTAHEVGHLQGAAHHDSFIPVGAGVASPGFLGDFIPPYPGPAGAVLTGKEILGLTTAVEFNAGNLLASDLFFGPRSAAKILMGSVTAVDVDVGETASWHHDVGSPQALTLKRMEIPNMYPPGEPLFGDTLFADMAIVEEATLGLDGPMIPPESSIPPTSTAATSETTTGGNHRLPDDRPGASRGWRLRGPGLPHGQAHAGRARRAPALHRLLRGRTSGSGPGACMAETGRPGRSPAGFRRVRHRLA